MDGASQSPRVDAARWAGQRGTTTRRRQMIGRRPATSRPPGMLPWRPETSWIAMARLRCCTPFRTVARIVRPLAARARGYRGVSGGGNARAGQPGPAAQPAPATDCGAMAWLHLEW